MISSKSCALFTSPDIIVDPHPLDHCSIPFQPSQVLCVHISRRFILSHIPHLHWQLPQYATPQPSYLLLHPAPSTSSPASQKLQSHHPTVNLIPWHEPLVHNCHQLCILTHTEMCQSHCTCCYAETQHWAPSRKAMNCCFERQWAR
jgi:hypothetical protein